jgi:hypothetical protein
MTLKHASGSLDAIVCVAFQHSHVICFTMLSTFWDARTCSKIAPWRILRKVYSKRVVLKVSLEYLAVPLLFFVVCDRVTGYQPCGP